MGLLAALLWGATDFLVGMNARAVGVKRAVFFGQALGFSIMSVLLIAFPMFILKSMSASVEAWLFGVVAAALTVSGALALSKAFALGIEQRGHFGQGLCDGGVGRFGRGELKVGDGLKGDTAQGPLIDERAVAKVRQHIDALDDRIVALLAERSGFATGLSLDGLLSAVDFAQEQLQRPLGGRSIAWLRRQRDKRREAEPVPA